MDGERAYAVFDVDDTLTSFKEPYLRWTQRRGVPREEAWDPALINLFMRDAHPDMLSPTPGSKQALELITRRYHPIAVSARDSDLVPYTERLLAHHFPGRFASKDIIHVGHVDGNPLGCKLEAVLDRGAEPSFIVDDRFKTALVYADRGIRAFHIGLSEASHERIVSYPDHQTAWKDIPKRVLNGTNR